MVCLKPLRYDKLTFLRLTNVETIISEINGEQLTR